MMKAKLLLVGLALLSAPVAAQRGAAPFVVQETGQGFGRLRRRWTRSATVRAPSWSHRAATAIARFRAQAWWRSLLSSLARPSFDGGACEGKATLVLRGKGARVEGLTFQNIQVPDQNGAGIRLEQGNLHVLETMFRNSQQGILTGSDLKSQIVVERSTFSGLGICPEGGSCAHSLYIGNYGKLSVIRSRFERGTGGHYVKTRTPLVEIVDSSFDDTGGKATNYMIDLSNGGSGTIARNKFVQGRNKENYSALIMIAAEGVWHPSKLSVTGNDVSVAPGVDRKTSFVADATGDAIRIENNRIGPQITRYERR
jgi:hypothetical protein